MTYLSTVTSKGQATIPKDIRLLLGLTPGSQVTFFEEAGEVKVKPAASFFGYKGAVKGPDSANLRSARNSVGQLLSKRHAI